jgi:hypothetical protein
MLIGAVWRARHTAANNGALQYNPSMEVERVTPIELLTRRASAV